LLPITLGHRYLAHLHAKQPAKDAVMEFATGYEDYLEIPLQVNLVLGACLPFVVGTSTH